MVEHKGFEPLTSSMPWKRASQLRQCPSSELRNYIKLSLLILVVGAVAGITAHHVAINRHR